jgi:hypothetical protein
MHTALVIFTTLMITAVITAVNARRKPFKYNQISPGKSSALIVTVIGLGFLGLGTLGFAGIISHGRNEGGGLALALAGIGALLAGFMAPSLTHAHDVVWCRDYVEGPSRMLGLTLGSKRRRVCGRTFAEQARPLQAMITSKLLTDDEFTGAISTLDLALSSKRYARG